MSFDERVRTLSGFATSRSGAIAAKLSQMAGARLRVLLIQSWTVWSEVVRSPLRAAGFEPQIIRVDFEPALEAALTRGNIDIIVYDPATPSMTQHLVETRLRECEISIPFVSLGDPAQLGQVVWKTLQALWN
jgi:hypothetical protein